MVQTSNPPPLVISSIASLDLENGFAKSVWRSLARKVFPCREAARRQKEKDTTVDSHRDSPKNMGTDQLHQALGDPVYERRWYAVFTVPQNEKSVATHLNLRDVESFLPTYETVKMWKNRQRIMTRRALFPSYLFVHVNHSERAKVLQSPGVLHIVGNNRRPLPLEDAEISFLRLALEGRQVEPYKDLVVGEKVRVKTGVLQGIEGTLVRKGSCPRFVLTMNLINQHAAIEVDADTLEGVPAKV